MGIFSGLTAKISSRETIKLEPYVSNLSSHEGLKEIFESAQSVYGQESLKRLLISQNCF